MLGRRQTELPVLRDNSLAFPSLFFDSDLSSDFAIIIGYFEILMPILYLQPIFDSLCPKPRLLSHCRKCEICSSSYAGILHPNFVAFWLFLVDDGFRIPKELPASTKISGSKRRAVKTKQTCDLGFLYYAE